MLSTDIDQIIVPHSIDFYPQRIDIDDYQQLGFSSADIADYWSVHGGGIACLRMIIDGLAKRQDLPKTQSEWIHLAIKHEAYSGKNWIHRELIAMAEQVASVHGIARRNCTVVDLFHDLIKDRPCIASVTPQFQGKQEQRSGGHLVVVLGVEMVGNVVSRVLVHHPASLFIYDWAHKWIDVHAFEKSFSGSYMAFWE